jgi:hypothetical protein
VFGGYQRRAARPCYNSAHWQAVKLLHSGFTVRHFEGNHNQAPDHYEISSHFAAKSCFHCPCIPGVSCRGDVTLTKE